MGYSWSETIDVGTNIEEVDIDEIRTNINTERTTRAGLGAYSWTNVDLEGDTIADEVDELRTATDEAYDLLFDCGSHYTGDDAVHYATDKTDHNSSADETHYSSDKVSHYTGDDAAHDATHYTTHYITHDSTNCTTHYSAANSSRKTNYLVAGK
jgi:hypothetical protein